MLKEIEGIKELQIDWDKRPSEIQQQLNEYFTLERRERMIAESNSVDKYGRKVVYFRTMSLVRLKELLAKGIQTTKDLGMGWFLKPEKPNQIMTSKEKFRYFENYLMHHDIDIYYPAEGSNIKFERDDYSPESLNRIIELVGKINNVSISEEMREALMDPDVTFEQFNEFVDYFISHDFKQKNRDLSSYISVSVGGPMSYVSEKYTAYVEMVIPESEILDMPNRLEGEKEMLVSRYLASDWITRVYVSTDQMYDEIIELHPDLKMLYELYLTCRHEGEEKLTNEQVVFLEEIVKREYDAPAGTPEFQDKYEMLISELIQGDTLNFWRWHMDTYDYVPVNLLPEDRK